MKSLILIKGKLFKELRAFNHFIREMRSMAGQIRMTPEELKSKAQTYGQGSDQIDDVLRKLKNLQDQLRGEWEGRAFERFDDQFRELEPKVQNFSQLLMEIQTQLQKTAQAVQEQDEALSQNFGLR